MIEAKEKSIKETMDNINRMANLLTASLGYKSYKYIPAMKGYEDSLPDLWTPIY